MKYDYQHYDNCDYEDSDVHSDYIDGDGGNENDDDEEEEYDNDDDDDDNGLIVNWTYPLFIIIILIVWHIT